jgi:AraC-like DNA-binding protein
VDVSLDELARLSAISPYHLVRSFQKEFGLPPHAYQIQSRLRLARKLLKRGHTISDTAQECGFHDQSHFHRHFKRANGYTPGQYLNML